jgi:phenylpropionate dioxygenase-like ring-hydroxylating dioxygenase large terminal subunit
MHSDEVDERLERASTLPAAFYAGPERLALEHERIFAKSWQLVGRQEQVASPGSFFTAGIGNEPILVVRGGDGVLRALSNVCRHRAGPVAAGEGVCRGFRCGYHGWSYGLDGSLLNTPEFDGVEDFAPDQSGLPAFRIESWLGLLFVAIDAGVPPLGEFLGELGGLAQRRDFSQMRLARRKDWYLDCNWKVYVDNYLEGYHIPIVHPSLMREIDYARYSTETRRFFSIQHSPIRASKDSPLRPQAGDEAEYYWVFPNLMLNVYPDNFSMNLIVPLGPDKTLTIFEWFFQDPGAPAVAERIRRTVDFSDEIQREDIAICEAVQRGLRSRTYGRGRFSVRRENGVHHFHRLYQEFMSGTETPKM